MQLDHFTIVTPAIEALRRFFVEVAGMTDGARPAFGIPGHWLYLDGHAVLHLVAGPATAAHHAGTRIDHVALRVDDPGEWRALRERLQASATPFQEGAIASLRQQQLFVALAPGAAVEFIHTQA
jgi:catechol 2,3-dioxygenase-like lactoylglutathione lyase family enzyme